MINKRTFEDLKIPLLPPDDTDRLNDQTLSDEYRAVADAIIESHAAVDGHLTRAVDATNCMDAKKLKSELSAFRAESLQLATNAVALANRRAALKQPGRLAHVKHRDARAKEYCQAEEVKKAELRKFNGGELPWNWLSTLEEALRNERTAVLWEPALIREAATHPAESPEFKAARALRLLIVESLGFDPNI